MQLLNVTPQKFLYPEGAYRRYRLYMSKSLNRVLLLGSLGSICFYLFFYGVDPVSTSRYFVSIVGVNMALGFLWLFASRLSKDPLGPKSSKNFSFIEFNSHGFLRDDVFTPWFDDVWREPANFKSLQVNQLTPEFIEVTIDFSQFAGQNGYPRTLSFDVPNEAKNFLTNLGSEFTRVRQLFVK